MEAEFHGVYDEDIARKVQRWLMLTVAACLAVFGLLLMPGLMLRLQKTTPGGKYVKMLELQPEPQMVAKWGVGFFPNNMFTNLQGDYEVRCQNSDCDDDGYFIGEQSHMLYRGMEAVASGKALRPARQSDID